MPMRGRPTCPRSSKTQKLTESRISGLSGRSANVYSRAGSMPPVKSMVIDVSPSVGVVGEQRPNCVEVQAECVRLGFGVWFALFGVLRPPGAHCSFEFVGQRLAEPGVESSNLPDGIGLHRAKTDVVEPAFGSLVAEFHRPPHAD